MKIFVAGGNGFLGSRVTHKLGIEYPDYDVVSLSQRNGYDFRDIDQVESLFSEHNFDVLINCAAYVGGIQFGYQHAGEIYYNNTLISTNLFEAAKDSDVKKVVNPISNCSYPGDLTEEFSEEDWWDGKLHDSVLIYGMVRKMSWVQSRAYEMQYGLNTTNLILPNMYGPGDHFDEIRSHALGALIMKFVEAKRKGHPNVLIWGTGNPVREWLYVDDGAEILLRSINKNTGTDPINVGVGKGISIKDLALLISDIVEYEGKIVYDLSKPDGAPYKTMNNKKLIETFDWHPPTGLRQGIESTVNWYMNLY